MPVACVDHLAAFFGLDSSQIQGQQAAQNLIVTGFWRVVSPVVSVGNGIIQRLVGQLEPLGGSDPVFDLTDDDLRVTLPARLAA